MALTTEKETKKLLGLLFLIAQKDDQTKTSIQPQKTRWVILRLIIPTMNKKIAGSEVKAANAPNEYKYDLGIVDS